MPDWLAPVVVALLVLGLSGSAGPPPPALATMLSVPVSAADPYTLTSTGDLLVQSQGTLASYALTDGGVHWRTGVEMPSYRLNTGSGLLLLRSASVSGRSPVAVSTRALALNTGDVRWRRAGTVVTIAGSTTLLAVSGVRSFAGEGRRVEGSIAALSSATGEVSWEVPVPHTAVLLGIPGFNDEPGRMLLVHDDRTAAVHDMGTGARLATGALPAADYGPDNPVVTGGLVLLRHPTPEGRMVSAFDARTLEPRWSRPSGFAFGISVCGPYACLTGPDGVRAVNVSDGGVRWFQPGWRRVEQRGDLLAAFGTEEGGENDLVGLVNPATGALVTDLHGWRPVTGDGGDHLLVTRTEGAAGRTMVAVATPDDPHPRIFADLPPGAADCRSVPGRLACREVSGRLTLWAYQRKE
ncbi:outer membrane protein assembly factor BamB family protein [Symbioplanes lichenis]|uniref:outer membrane protein assembly factor BamB family protein n=1 Tax=Symbioplanes lichenis TaxID=1629072 RepID=UPI00273A465F|nr:PQQ-binding-like beta-propeller repeat protein [Actinoplanes lichenis]